ncbi:MAG: YbaB/EbfC family nucleoid-associated protein [Rectinemataceae bacterium]
MMNFAEIMEMLRNPQALQAQMTELREKTERIRATGNSGGGMVRVTLNGALEMLSCEISPEIVAGGDTALIQDLVRGAFNDAAAKVKESLQAELSSGMGGMPFPPGMLGGL